MKRPVVLQVDTDWTPAQAQKAFDERLEMAVAVGGTAQTLTVSGFSVLDDDIRTTLYLTGELDIVLGEAPEVETSHVSSI